jgi:hypothetical protein
MDPFQVLIVVAVIILGYFSIVWWVFVVLIFRKSLSIYWPFMKKSGFHKETFLNRIFFLSKAVYLKQILSTG